MGTLFGRAGLYLVAVEALRLNTLTDGHPLRTSD